MEITEQSLKQIIKEEVEVFLNSKDPVLHAAKVASEVFVKVLNEGSNKKLLEQAFGALRECMKKDLEESEGQGENNV